MRKGAALFFGCFAEKSEIWAEQTLAYAFRYLIRRARDSAAVIAPHLYPPGGGYSLWYPDAGRKVGALAGYRAFLRHRKVPRRAFPFHALGRPSVYRRLALSQSAAGRGHWRTSGGECSSQCERPQRSGGQNGFGNLGGCVGNGRFEGVYFSRRVRSYPQPLGYFCRERGANNC